MKDLILRWVWGSKGWRLRWNWSLEWKLLLLTLISHDGSQWLCPDPRIEKCAGRPIIWQSSRRQWLWKICTIVTYQLPLPRISNLHGSVNKMAKKKENKWTQYKGLERARAMNGHTHTHNHNNKVSSSGNIYTKKYIYMKREKKGRNPSSDRMVEYVALWNALYSICVPFGERLEREWEWCGSFGAKKRIHPHTWKEDKAKSSKANWTLGIRPSSSLSPWQAFRSRSFSGTPTRPWERGGTWRFSKHVLLFPSRCLSVQSCGTNLRTSHTTASISMAGICNAFSCDDEGRSPPAPTHPQTRIPKWNHTPAIGAGCRVRQSSSLWEDDDEDEEKVEKKTYI